MAVINDPTDKKCFNCCPNCGATDPDIEWGEKHWMDDGAYQDAECRRCDCYFKEYYQYTDTEFEVGAVPRIRCDYPMSDFHIWKHEIVSGDRVSTTEDCEQCSEDCEEKHCLIGEELVPPVDRHKYTNR